MTRTQAIDRGRQAVVAAAFVLLVGMAGCDGTGKKAPAPRAATPPAHLEPHRSVHATNPDPAKIVTVTDAGGHQASFPVDEAVVFAAKGATRKQISAAARRAGGRIIGQVPSLGLYQVELPTHTPAELEKAIKKLKSDAAVSDASENAMVPAATTPSTSGRKPAPSPALHPGDGVPRGAAVGGP